TTPTRILLPPNLEVLQIDIKSQGYREPDTVMSDYEDSTVIHTAFSSPFRGLSDIGSPGVDGPPVMPEDSYAYVVAAFQAPPSPDYVSGPEYPPSPDFVPDLVYPEFMPPEDEVPESDLEEDPEEDDDEDPKEDPANYPADEGDDGDDEDESSNDDEDDDVDIEEEEHPAPVDSTAVALPAVDQAPSAEETEPFETDELLAIPTPPPSPLSSWSSPLPQIPSPLLPLILSPLTISPPLPVSSPPHASPICLLGYRAAMIRLRAEALSTSHSLPLPPPIILSYTRSDAPSSGTPPLLPIPLPTSSPPLHLLSTDRIADKPEVTLPPQKRLCIALGPRYEVGESSSAPTARPPGGFRADYGFVATIYREIMRDLERDVGYGIIDTWDEMLVDMLGAPATDDTELGRRLIKAEKVLVRGGSRMSRASLGTDPWMASKKGCWLLGEGVPLHDQRLWHYNNATKIRTTRLNHKQQPQLSTPRHQHRHYGLLKAMIDQAVTAALAVRDANRNTNGDDSHISGAGVRRTERTAHECTYTDFLKCKPLNFKGTEGVAGLSQGGLPDTIHGSVVASKPKTLQDAVEITTELMDKKIRTFAERQTESKRKFEDTSRNTQNQQQQQQNKRQNTGRAYTAGTGEKKQYGGSKPLCSKCNYHHDGPCAPRCHKCNKVGHLARDCRSTANANNANNQRGTGSSHKPTCYECEVQGHFKRECPKLKNNNNRGNQVGGGNALAKVYAVGHAGTNPDSNVVMGTFLLNNRYASILFDTGTDRSFVSTAFSSQIDITNINRSSINHYLCTLTLADGRIIRVEHNR
ncbi:reverse transcriptase domain-containing protein, partial [Tanacetum coccineum]